MSDQHSAGQQEQIQKFAKLAAAYCSFLEDHCAYSTKQFIRQTEEYLAAIHEAVSGLPQESVITDSQIDPGPTSWLARNAAEKLGDQDRYAIVTDPDVEPLLANFSENLTKIYSYLKQGVLLYNTDPASAVSHWHSKFDTDCVFDLEAASEGLHRLLAEDALSK
jgi:hypothetical protein